MREFEVSYSRLAADGSIAPLSSTEGFTEVTTSIGRSSFSLGFAAGDLAVYDMNSAFEFTGIPGFATEMSLTVPCGSKRMYDDDHIVEVVDLKTIIPGRFIAASSKSGLIGTHRGMIAWCPQLSKACSTALNVRFAALALRGSRRIVWVCTGCDVVGVNYDMTGDPVRVDEMSTVRGTVLANGSIEVIDRSDRRKRRSLKGPESARGLGLMTLAYPLPTRVGDLSLALYCESSSIQFFHRGFVISPK